MKVRSVTLGNNLAWPLSSGEFAKAQRFLSRAATVFREGGVEVQTVRLATQPLRTVTANAIDFARAVEAACRDHGIEYCSLGPGPADRGLLAGLIASTSIVFVSLSVTAGDAPDFAAIEAAAGVVHDVARSTELGFGNLRFAAAASCGPNIPFFPAAYHDGGHPKFSLALQGADAVLEAFSLEGSLSEVEQRLKDRLAAFDQLIYPLAKQLEREFAIEYLGADFCPAPFPADADSIARAIEAFGVEQFGAAGTLYAASLLTRAVKTAPVHHWGLNGLMLPVLEDSGLAARTAGGTYTVNDLLLYSAVCGTGLDTVPLPGDISQEELAGIILDVAALSLTLGRKPLLARLLPVPGKRAGEQTEYEFEYFANGRVLPVKGLSSAGIFRRARP